MDELKKCPICTGNELREWLSAKDYFFSGEEFTIAVCKSCEFRFLNPRPDENAIGKYYHSPDYVAHSNKSWGLMTHLYRIARQRNLKYKYEILSKYIGSGKVLDIGCATAEFLEYMRQKNWEIAGMEPDPYVREKTAVEKQIDIVGKDGLKIFPSQSFQLITLWHVLEHVHRLDEQIEEIKRLLSENGFLVLALPNPDSYDASYYGKYWAGFDLPRHLYHFSPADVETLFQKYGFNLINTHPLKFDAFYVSMLSEKYKRGKPAMLSAIKIALKSNAVAKQKKLNFSSLIYVLRRKQANSGRLDE
jgi:SAM-dependent methyltransferase